MIISFHFTDSASGHTLQQIAPIVAVVFNKPYFIDDSIIISKALVTAVALVDQY